MHDQITDEEILGRIRAGDKSACALCIDRYGNQVYRLAIRLMENEADAEDVVQETFLSAFRAIDSFEGRSNLGTWLYRIAYNAAMMKLRRPSPRLVSVDHKYADGETAMVVPQQLYDWCCLPETEFESDEVRGLLEQAIRELPSTLRGVFILRELEGLSTIETAETLAVSTDVVKTRLRRARLWLREKLSDHFAEREHVGSNA